MSCHDIPRHIEKPSWRQGMTARQDPGCCVCDLSGQEIVKRKALFMRKEREGLAPDGHGHDSEIRQTDAR